MEKSVNFASRLKELMLEKNINQFNLSKQVNISNQAISFWLSCKREPKLSYLWILADFFEVSLDILVGRDDY